ncbi:MAG: glycosyltransferase family 4 protein [Spirochaetes bacterium]|nr:glycosyltransferase family 4 protein [Spirochaetota bacterium]
MKDEKILLFILPLPPPVTGQSIISKAVYEHFNNKHNIVLFNYQRTSLSKSTILNFGQIIKTFNFLKIIKKYRDRADLVYLNLSVSLLGNLKDIFILFMLGKLRKKTIIHLHSGGFLRYIKRSFFIVKLLNKLLMKDIYKGIVLGESLKDNLLNLMDENKISVINNFYEPDILISEDQLKKKWDRIDWDTDGKLNLIFFSNMIIGKGYLDLLNGFLNLDERTKNKCVLYFTGEFDNIGNKRIFLGKIKKITNIYYIENVDGLEKKKLLNKSHAFFLPSRMLEGQPISILEAYASGCAVFTTNTGGIKDIFNENKNGNFIKGKYDKSISFLISSLINSTEKYKKIAIFNRNYSLNYSKDKFLKKIKDLFDELMINE